MTQDETIELARQAGLHVATDVNCMPIIGLEYAEKLIELVAKHTLMNIDPSKFISCQEVMEAARLAEREACAKVADNRLLLDASSKERNIYDLARKNIAADIRARGEA